MIQMMTLFKILKMSTSEKHEISLPLGYYISSTADQETSLDNEESPRLKRNDASFHKKVSKKSIDEYGAEMMPEDSEKRPRLKDRDFDKGEKSQGC